jgi:hypothetical protein
MARYTVYPGKFVCHTCRCEVKSLRLYPDSKEMTWVCYEKHLSSVNLNTRKSKRDYERKV